MSKKIPFNVLILSFLALGFAKAQNIAIGDAKFKERLLDASPNNGVAKDVDGNAVAIDTNGDGEISYAEALNIGQLTIEGGNTSSEWVLSLEGIQYFTNLTVLRCNWLRVNSLDFSSLTKLKELYLPMVLTRNYEVAKGWDGYLSSLTLPKTQTLEVLDIRNSSIKSLDFLSGYPNLKKLNIDNANVENINITGAQFPHLEELSAMQRISNVNVTLSDLPELTTLNCGVPLLNGCSYYLSSDIDWNCAASALPTSQLPKINLSLSNLPKIEALNIQGKNITINNLPNLTSLNCSSYISTVITYPCPVESLVLSGVPKLTEIFADGHMLKTLDLSNVPNLVTLSCRGILSSGYEKENFPGYESNNYPILENLDVSKNINLQTLDLSNNNLLTLDVSKNINLQGLGLKYNANLKMLDVSHNINLAGLYLGGCTGLTSLYMKNGVKKTFEIGPTYNYPIYLNNTNFYCLNDTSLNYICCDEDEVDAVKDYMQSFTQWDNDTQSHYSLNPTVTSDCGEETPATILDLSTGKGTNGELLPVSGVTDYNWYYTREDGTGQNPVTRDAYGAGTSAAWSYPTLSSQGDIQNSVWVTGASTDPRAGYFDYISKTFTIPAGVTDAKLDLKVLSFVRDWVYLVNEDTGTETEISRTEWFEDQIPKAAGWLNSRTPEVIGYALAPGNYHLKVHVWSQNAITHAISANVVVTTGQEELPVLTVSNVTENGATLGWSAVAGAASYTVEYKKLAVTTAGQKSITTFADDWTTISGITATTYTLTGLADGSIYEWRLTAVGSGDETPVSGPFFTTVIKPLGTEDLSPQAKVALYPNPVKEVLYFSASGKVAKAEIYDLNGRLVKTAVVSNNSVNVSSLSKGVYLIILHTDKGVVKEKFIKN